MTCFLLSIFYVFTNITSPLVPVLPRFSKKCFVSSLDLVLSFSNHSCTSAMAKTSLRYAGDKKAQNLDIYFWTPCSFIVVCTVVSSSNRPHIIAVALSVSSPRLPSVVLYWETDLQCLLVFPWLGNSWSAQTVVIVFPLQNSSALTNLLHRFLQDLR